jgi:hypothetical protein
MGGKLGCSYCGEVFENRVLRRIFGPKEEDVTREWRKLHNESLMTCTPH